MVGLTGCDVRFLPGPETFPDRESAKEWTCGAAALAFSAAGPVRCTHLATDGTPLASTANSMYQPGGARLGLFVTFRSTLLPLTDSGRSTKRWLGSEEWVTAAGRISSALAIGRSTVIRW